MYGRVVFVIATSWIVSCASGATEQTGALLAPPADAVIGRDALVVADASAGNDALVVADAFVGSDAAVATVRYKDIDNPADTPQPFKATYTNSNNPWVPGCVLEFDNATCQGDGTPQKLDACDGAMLNEAVTDNSGDCVDKAGAYAQYDCNQECKNAGFVNGTCETKAVAACGTTKVGYCVCGPKADR
jgi:hypothetical protein